MAFDLGNVAGAGIGALLGGMDANAGPAGTTTKTQTQDLPQWLKDYYSSNIAGGSSLRDSLTGNTNPLVGMSEDELANVISGKYLSPDSNPWLAQTGKIVSDQIGRSVDSRFEGSGRYGSGAFQDLLGTSVGKALTELYGGNYQAERNRQYGATLAAPSVMSGNVAARFAPYEAFTKLLPNLKNTTTTEPYFRNKGAGILGGALAGSQLAKMFGFGGGGGGDGYSMVNGYTPSADASSGGAMDMGGSGSIFGGATAAGGSEVAGEEAISAWLPYLSYLAAA